MNRSFADSFMIIVYLKCKVGRARGRSGGTSCNSDLGTSYEDLSLAVTKPDMNPRLSGDLTFAVTSPFFTLLYL